MAAKKHGKRTTAAKTAQTGPTTGATDEAISTGAPVPAESVPVDTAEVPDAPIVETTGAATPASGAVETIAPAPILASQPTPAPKLSALDAAAKVLNETGRAMSCGELIAAMGAKGYWSSPKGRTPAGTLYSAVLREIQTRGDKSRFHKTARGQFALRATV
jgi:hypothetical protein